MSQSEEERQLKEGREYLEKLLEAGELDKETYTTMLQSMDENTQLFVRGLSSEGSAEFFGANGDELFSFGRSYKEVLGNYAEAEPHQLLSNLSAIIMLKEQERGLESLTQAERYIYVIDGMLTEVNNGGFDQFFFNSSGELAYELTEALEAMGSTRFKTIAAKAVEIFGETPSLNEEARLDHLKRITKDGELHLWSQCDDEFYECEEEIESLVVTYAKTTLI